ncbi:MAG: YabP/YqfC family sporulation protein [Eubacteriales bacterium]|nr:YabP/YqfC family sporulation protein [Eubacteriales bacterium]MDD3199078.1 YabP/YqfC family sporulation protein [Eubacteriales bacterium]MDD4122111.1 YabP/YqfC family sporulation protein [Eubacteriales bacterium]MDD4629679.1 YabP/YqfC family sporulation protein [Eubacteriales bacterium]
MDTHVVNIDNRERVSVTEVIDIESFNEEIILLILKNGGLVIKGEDLHIQKLDLEEGKVLISGAIGSAVYTEKKDRQEKGFLKKILK